MKKFINIGAIPTETDSIKTYIKETKKLNALTKQEEAVLIEKAQAGDLTSRDALITHNLKFVMQVARNYVGLGVQYEDIVQAGNLGLFDAIRKFKQGTNVKLISFAIWDIRNRINELINDTSRTVRMPSSAIDKRDQYGTLDIDAKMGNSAEDETFANYYLEDENASKTDFEKSEFKSAMHGILTNTKLLSDIEATVLCKFYGIGFDYPKTMVQIAEDLNVSNERVRQVIRNAEANLAKVKEVQELRSYL